MKIYTIILLTTLLCGCVTKKKLLEVTRSEKVQFEQKDVHKEVKQTENITTAKEWQAAVKGEEDVEITHTKYDTSKPINPETGRPPIESETKAVKHSKASKDSKVSASAIVEAEKVEIHQDSTQSTSAEKIETTKDEKIKKSLPLYIYIVGVGILALAIWAVWHWSKR